MTYENYVKARLVDFVVKEALHLGGVKPMLAIAQTLANRVNAGWAGGDWLRVINSAPTFVGVLWNEEILHFNPRDVAFRELLRRIDEVYHGTADDSDVNNEQGQKAMYYAELPIINREWFTETILKDPTSHPRIAQVDQITFFG